MFLFALVKLYEVESRKLSIKNYMNFALNFTSIVNTIISLVCFYCFFRIKRDIQTRKAQAQEDQAIIDFKNFYFWYGMGYIIFVLPQFFLLSASWALTGGYIAGIFFIMAGNGYFLKISTYFIFPKYAKTAFWLVIGYGIAGIAANLIFPPHIYFNLNTHQLVKEAGKLDTFFTLGLLPVIYFGILSILSYGLGAKDRYIRNRSLILVVGLLFIFIGAPVQSFAEKTWQFVLANFFIIAGYPVLLSAILYRRE